MPQAQLIQMLILCLLVFDVFSYHFLIPPDRGYKVASGPEVLTYEVALFASYTRARCIALLPLINPTTCDTACFGGIDINMCT